MHYFLLHEVEDSVYAIPLEYMICDLKVAPRAKPLTASLLILREKQRQQRIRVIYYCAGYAGICLRVPVVATVRIVFAGFMFNLTGQVFHHYGVFADILEVLPKRRDDVHSMKTLWKFVSPSSFGGVWTAIKDAGYVQLGTRAVFACIRFIWGNV